MSINEFRTFIRENDLNCLEIHYVDEMYEFLIDTGKEHKLFRVVYSNDKNGNLRFSEMHITKGNIDNRIDTTMKYMMLYPQYMGMKHYRGKNIMPFPESEV